MSAQAPGTPSPAERVAAVEQAEREAARRVADARKAAEALVTEARAGGAADLKRSVEEAEEQARELIAEAVETAERQAEQVLAAAEKERRAVARQAAARAHAATDLVIERLAPGD